MMRFLPNLSTATTNSSANPNSAPTPAVSVTPAQSSYEKQSGVVAPSTIRDNPIVSQVGTAAPTGNDTDHTALESADMSKQASSESITQSMVGKRPSQRERRIMPARLQRVSSLLAGSTLEEELYGTNAKIEDDLLPSSTRILLTTKPDGDYELIPGGLLDQEQSFFTNPEIARACRNRELIETPEFSIRDDTEMMGKTRRIRSVEDTSDAAYERRHRKPDNLEKKQRRLEKEGLIKDRQKLKERIDQLRVADSRLLMPILTAREQHQKQTGPSQEDGSGSDQATTAEAADSHQQASHRANLAAEATQTMSKLELLRTELLQEASETLKRYDALLLPVEMTPGLAMGKRKASDSTDEVSLGAKPKRSISVSGAFGAAKKPSALGRSLYTNGSESDTASGMRSSSLSKVQTPATATAAAVAGTKRKASSSASRSESSAKRLSLVSDVPKSPIPFKPGDGPVRAENTYANIHARTSGGRFAPKSALPGTTGAGSSSKINTKGKWKAEGREKPTRGENKKPNTAPKRVRKTKAAYQALAEDPNNSRRKVKIVLSKKAKDADVASGATSTASATGGDLARVEVTKMDEDEKDDDEEAVPITATRAALTLEEAQALLAKELEDDDDDDNEDDHEVEMQVKPE